MAIVMQRSTSGRTSLAFWIVVMMRPLTLGLFLSLGIVLALGEDQRAGQAAQQGPLMVRIAAEVAAFSSMSHDSGAFSLGGSRELGTGSMTQTPCSKLLAPRFFTP